MSNLLVAGIELQGWVEAAVIPAQAGSQGSRSTYKHLSKRSVLYKARRKIEKVKAQARAKVEHPFCVIKRQFGYVKTRFSGLAKNTAQLTTLFARRICRWWAGNYCLQRERYAREGKKPTLCLGYPIISG